MAKDKSLHLSQKQLGLADNPIIHDKDPLASDAGETEMNANLPAWRKEVIMETMECAKGIVQSYGPNTIAQVDRDNLCRAMDHYARTGK